MTSSNNVVPYVYCYGMVASSTLHLLDTLYPQANGYAEIKSSQTNIAGEAVAGAWVLQRLGIRTKLDGRWLSDTPQSTLLLAMLSEQGIDVSRLEIKKDYRPVEEIVIADGHSRTVFAGYNHILFSDRQWNAPIEEDVARASLVLLDPFLGKESQLCAEYCVKHRVPYITCDVEPTHYIAQHAFANLVSEEFLLREYNRILAKAALPVASERQDNYAIVYQEFLAQCPGWLMFTFGGHPLWYSLPTQPSEAPKDRSIHRFTPYAVQLVDSTGAGDSFRAGFAFGVLQGWTAEKLVASASATAGLVCETFPGVLNGPAQADVLRLMDSR